MPERSQIVRDNEGSLERMAGEYSEPPADLKIRIGKLLEEAGLTRPTDVPGSTSPLTTSTGR